LQEHAHIYNCALKCSEKHLAHASQGGDGERHVFQLQYPANFLQDFDADFVGQQLHPLQPEPVVVLCA
jgi:hypothetical protein